MCHHIVAFPVKGHLLKICSIFSEWRDTKKNWLTLFRIASIQRYTLFLLWRSLVELDRLELQTGLQLINQYGVILKVFVVQIFHSMEGVVSDGTRSEECWGLKNFIVTGACFQLRNGELSCKIRTHLLNLSYRRFLMASCNLKSFLYYQGVCNHHTILEPENSECYPDTRGLATYISGESPYFHCLNCTLDSGTKC